MHSKKDPSQKSQISRTKTTLYPSLKFGTWNLEFGIWALMNVEIYPVFCIIAIYSCFQDSPGIYPGMLFPEDK